MALPDEPQSLPGKERKEVLSRPKKEEEYPVVERSTRPDIPPGIEHVEAVAGAEAALPKPVTDDSGQAVVSPTSPQSTTVVLPLTEEEVKQALHLKVIYSLRWLAEWTKRMFKKASRSKIDNSKQ